MWSSLTLAPIINCFRMRPAWKSPWMRQPPASCVNIVSCSWMWILSIVWACMNIVSEVLQECCQFSLDASLALHPAWISQLPIVCGWVWHDYRQLFPAASASASRTLNTLRPGYCQLSLEVSLSVFYPAWMSFNGCLAASCMMSSFVLRCNCPFVACAHPHLQFYDIK